MKTVVSPPRQQAGSAAAARGTQRHRKEQQQRDKLLSVSRPLYRTACRGTQTVSITFSEMRAQANTSAVICRTLG